MKYLKTTSWFTLVEIVLATTILAVMATIIMSIYIQTTNLSSRLKATRYLSETSREITERIAEDVKERGMTWLVLPVSHPYWNGSSGYTSNGSEILGIGDGTTFYLYGKKSLGGIDPCDLVSQKDPSTHCGLYKVRGTDYLWALNLVDSFIPEESKKRVKIEDLKFYISWDGNSTEKKLTLVFTLALMPRIGVPDSNITESKLRIQTTISERFFRSSAP